MNVSTTFKSMLTMLAAFFSAGEKIGKTLDNLAEVAYQTSAAYVDEAAADREAKAAARAKATLEAQAAIETAAKTSSKAAVKA